jgi:hypothetical protein
MPGANECGAGSELTRERMGSEAAEELPGRAGEAGSVRALGGGGRDGHDDLGKRRGWLPLSEDGVIKA